MVQNSESSLCCSADRYCGKDSKGFDRWCNNCVYVIDGEGKCDFIPAPCTTEQCQAIVNDPWKIDNKLKHFNYQHMMLQTQENSLKKSIKIRISSSKLSIPQMKKLLENRNTKFELMAKYATRGKLEVNFLSSVPANKSITQPYYVSPKKVKMSKEQLNLARVQDLKKDVYKMKLKVNHENHLSTYKLNNSSDNVLLISQIKELNRLEGELKQLLTLTNMYGN